MADKKVEYEIKIIGDALERLKQITGQTEDLGNAATRATSKLAGIGKAFIVANQALEFVKKAADKMREYTDASKADAEAQAKLAQRRSKKRKNPYEKGFPAKRLLLTGWFPSFWRLVIKEVRCLFWGVVDVELTDELEAVLEVGAFGLGEGVKEAESGDESDLLGLDGHVLFGCGDDLPEGGEEVLELMVGDKKLDFWRRNGVFGVVARVVEEVRDAVERACDGVVIIWKRDFYGGG